MPVDPNMPEAERAVRRAQRDYEFSVADPAWEPNRGAFPLPPSRAWSAPVILGAAVLVLSAVVLALGIAAAP